MTHPQTHSLLVLSAERGQHLSHDQIADLLEYFEPDDALLIRDGVGHHVFSRISWEVEDAIPNGETLYTLDRNTLETISTDAGTIVLAPNPSSHSVVSEAVDPDEQTFVFTDSVSVSMNQMELTASIEGLAPFRDHEGGLTVFSSGLDADYWVNHEGLPVRGLAPVRSSTIKIPCFRLSADGVVTIETLAERKLGIRALSGMGKTYAERFHTAGYGSVQDIHEASARDIRQIQGVGEQRATQFKKQAKALVKGEIVRLSDDATLPSEVVHIDIETDGLSPTIIWQIGLYDSRADEFRTFLQQDPTEKAPILRKFGAWLNAHLDDRAVVAYNGWNFDFPHLEEFFRRHAPEYYDTWRYARKVDPLDWATRENNAVLPGRSNGLDDVAEALGYEREDTGLDGATTAHIYQQWMENPCDSTEPDWNRHTTYCREDVLALHHVYECLLDSRRLLGDQNTDRPTDENTTQGTLFDY